MTSTLLILSLPPKTFVGLDLLSFDSSPNFEGITKIPPGIHFLYTGTNASLSIRHGRWLKFGSKAETLVLRWNGDSEALDLVDPPGPSARNAITSLPQGRRLVEYEALQTATSDLAARQSESEEHQDEDATPSNANEDRGESTDWPLLTTHISPSLFDRILSPDWLISSISSAPNDTETIPGLSHLEASNVLAQSPLNLLPINLKQTWSDGDIGRTRTDRARDRSWYLGHLIDTATPNDKAAGAKQILGELQSCFLMVLTLANYSCFEQWKRLLSIFFTCQTALDEIEAYFIEAVKTLHAQIRHVEDTDGGLFDLGDENASSWLRAVWARFRAVVDDDDEDEAVNGKGVKRVALKKEVKELQKLFEGRYGWASERDILRRGMVELEDGERVEVTMPGADEEDESGEYAPVVVET